MNNLNKLVVIMLFGFIILILVAEVLMLCGIPVLGCVY